MNDTTLTYCETINCEEVYTEDGSEKMENDGLLRLEVEVAGTTKKTLVFGVCYLPVSAQRRHARNGKSLKWAIQHQSTPSFCKNIDCQKTRHAAQEICDKMNGSGDKNFHVIERIAVPVIARKPFIPRCREDLDSKQRGCYDVAVVEACRDFDGEELDAELSSIRNEFFG